MPSLEQSVARVVLDHSSTASVFQRHRIDFCCRGERSIKEAAEERGVDPTVLVAELEEAIASRTGDAVDPRSLSSAALVGHIVGRHHEYLRKALPFVGALSAKVARVHGEHNPKLHELDTVVRTIRDELEPHLDSEEQTLFSAILAGGKDRDALARSFREMHQEHLVVGDLLEKMRDATDNFRLPEWACNSYRTLFAELEALEADVLRHVHLENHVLMPRFAS